MPTKKTKEPAETKVPSLNRIIAQINKKAGETVIGRLGDMENITAERIPTGVEIFDKALGGGFPAGRMVELYGLPSSGKSLISQLAIAQAQKRGEECVYVDAEGSFDPSFAKLLGVDTDKIALMQIGVGEDIFDTLAEILKAEPGVIVVDSVAALVTRAEMEDSVEKAEMASKARLMSKALRKINALNKKTLIIFINQLRQGIATWGPAPKVTTGGMALGFYSSVRIEVKRDKELLYEDGKKSGEVVGQIVQFHVTKNKTAKPYQVGSFKFFFDGHFE